MLRHKLIHPQITAVLAAAGHHSTVLIADGNYPAASKRGPRPRIDQFEPDAWDPHLQSSSRSNPLSDPGRSDSNHGNRD